MDNENWTLATTQNLLNSTGTQLIKLTNVQKAQYVKFECVSTHRQSTECPNSLTATMIKLYENVELAEEPRAEISYSTTGPTNQDVEAKLVNMTRPITVTNNDGNTSYTFKENGEFTFEFIDENGNIGSATANVNWIDKTVPELTVDFSTTELTNQEVIATLNFSKKDITILSEDVNVTESPVDNSKTITFLENASYDLKYSDILGNIGTTTITVDWIDKEAPTAKFEFSTMQLTYNPVTVKLIPSEEVTILNNNGSDTYTFNENGEITFEYMDKAGNIGSSTTKVDWIIDDNTTISSKQYEIDENYIFKIVPGTKADEFLENILTKEEIKLLNNRGKTITETTIIKTGDILKLGENKQFTLVVTGDVDGNGKVTSTDLSKIKLHLNKKKLLEGANLKAMDVNYDGEYTEEDSKLVNLYITGKVKF